MDLLKFLERIVKRLRKHDCRFAMAGGIVAAIFRKDLRATEDLDILLFANSDSEALAKEIIESFDLTAGVARLADLSRAPMPNKKSSPKVLVVGRKPHDETFPGLDFILPTMPWTQMAIVRAQEHCLDLGFGAVPCLTIEDLIVAKAYALKNDPTRFKDLDDLQSIFLGENEMDLSYLAGQMEHLGLALPKALKKQLPKSLRRFCSR